MLVQSPNTLLQELTFSKGSESVSYIHKFGANPNLVSGSQTIWSGEGLYPWSAFDNIQTLYLISTDSGDTGTIELQGLDADFLPITETVTMTGLTAKATQNQFKRIFRMVYTGPAGAPNLGTITARTVSGTGTVVSHMVEGTAQTLMAVYTVPANYQAYGAQYTVGIGKGGDAEFQVVTRSNSPTGSFRIRGNLELYQTTFTQTYKVPVLLPPKTDIDFRAVTTGNNFPATANFDLLLTKV